jgi:hypothetical protein
VPLYPAMNEEFLPSSDHDHCIPTDPHLIHTRRNALLVSTRSLLLASSHSSILPFFRSTHSSK